MGVYACAIMCVHAVDVCAWVPHQCVVLCGHVQVGMGGMDCYERDFEDHLLQDTGAFYKRKVSERMNTAH